MSDEHARDRFVLGRRHLLLVAMLLAAWGAFHGWRAFFSKSGFLESPAIVPVEGFSPVSFELTGTPKTTRGMHAHSPIFGGWGKDTYRFRGKIEFDHLTIPLDLTFEPLGVYRTPDGYHFLTRSYFSKNNFQWHVLDKTTGEFAPLEAPAASSAPVAFVFEDAELKMVHRIWILRKAIKEGDHRDALHIFTESVATNPRTFANPSWRGIKHKWRTLFTFLLEELGDATAHDVRLWDSLTSILEHAEPGDDPQDIMFVCFELQKADRARASGRASAHNWVTQTDRFYAARSFSSRRITARS